MSRLASLSLLLSAAVVTLPAQGKEAPRLLDGFDTAAGWTATHTDDVSASLRTVEGKTGHAICLDYDFNGVSGAASIRKTLPLDFPAGFALGFDVRGSMPPNTLQLKLIDDSGDNVWWFQQSGFVPTDAWQSVQASSRQVSFAWGPIKDRTLRHTREVEFVVYKEAHDQAPAPAGAMAGRPPRTAARCASTT